MALKQENSQQLTLSDVVLKLNATLDLETLLRDAVREVSSFLGAEAALILLPDQTRRVLKLRAHYRASHYQDDVSNSFEVDIQNSVPGKVFGTEEAYVMDVPADIFPNQPVKSLLYVPMVSRKKAVGVLGIYNVNEAMTVSQAKLSFLKQLASHAAVAIDNARIYADSQARRYELALIIDAAEAVNYTLSLPHVLSVIGKSLLAALRVNWSEVITWQPGTPQLMTLSSQRTAVWQADEAPVVPVQNPENLLALLRQEKWRIFQASGELPAAFLAGAQRLLALPFMKDGKLAAVVTMVFLEDLPDGLVNADNIESLQRKAQKLVDVGLSDDKDRALSFAHQLVREAEAQGCCLWQWDDAKRHFKKLIDDANFVWAEPPHPTRKMDDFPTVNIVFNRRSITTYHVADPALPEDIKRLMKEHQLRVMMLVPFVIQEDHLGIVLAADTSRSHGFEDQEQILAQTMVLQAAVAIKNAKLYEDLQHSLEELRRAQARLVQSARLGAIGELAAAVAHQINNPLTTILGDTQLMLEDIAPDDLNRESLQAVHRAGQRALEVVRRLLSMARQRPSDAPPELMDINLTIYNTLALVEGALYRARIQFNLDLAEDLPQAHGVSGELEDVWLNLILNARDALKQVKKPVVGIKSVYNPLKDTVEVSIWDNGPGFGDADISHIFDAFYTTKPPGEGTGLGLYICRSVVERCGGIIETGTSPDGGAMFIVSLPCER